MLLITGATGFIGSHLVARLVAQGERPRCLVRDKSRAAAILPSDKVELVQGETINPATLEAAMLGVDTIIHAAFMTADRKPSSGNQYEQTNVDGTRNLVDAAKAAGVKRIIEISGLGTRPGQPGSYSGLAWTIIRPSVLFGPGASFVKGLTDLLRVSPVVPLIGGGKILFQPIHVDDVVTVITKILAEPEQTNAKIYTIGGPDYYSFTQVFDILLNAMHIHRLKVYAPLPLVGIGAAVMEAILPKPPLTKAAMALFSFDNITDKNSVERDFGFTPISFATYTAEHGV
jgi:NADH dehydrogenase